MKKLLLISVLILTLAGCEINNGNVNKLVTSGCFDDEFPSEYFNYKDITYSEIDKKLENIQKNINLDLQKKINSLSTEKNIDKNLDIFTGQNPIVFYDENDEDLQKYFPIKYSPLKINGKQYKFTDLNVSFFNPIPRKPTKVEKAQNGDSVYAFELKRLICDEKNTCEIKNITFEYEDHPSYGATYRLGVFDWNFDNIQKNNDKETIMEHKKNLSIGFKILDKIEKKEELSYCDWRYIWKQNLKIYRKGDTNSSLIEPLMFYKGGIVSDNRQFIMFSFINGNEVYSFAMIKSDYSLEDFLKEVDRLNEELGFRK